MAVKRDAYRFKDGVTDLSAKTFNQIFSDLDARLHSLEQLGVTWKDAVFELQQFGLERINGALAPVLEQMTSDVAELNTQRTSFLAWWDSVKEDVVDIHAAAAAMQLALAEITAKVDGFEAVLAAGLATKADKETTDAAIIALEDVPFAYQRGVTLPSIKGYSVAADRAVLVWPRVRVVDRDTGIAHVIPATALNINSPLVWDDGQYATAANRAGRNFCLYLLSDGTLLLSANSIAPIGHTTVNSLKIGGFHCMCVSVGTISGHRLTGFVAGDILPDSVWDLMHRPSCAPSGMVYSQEADIWVDIYLQSGTGANTASVYGATITNERDWMDFVDDLAAVGKRLLSDPEFQVIASGSNEKTSIAGSADPITTGGHIDTAGRRMISNIGCEDCCGALWQWTGEQSYATNSATFTFSWFELPGGKGSIYKQGGTFGDVKLLAGGSWLNGTNCGSRSRSASDYRWATSAYIGARGCARSHT